MRRFLALAIFFSPCASIYGASFVVEPGQTVGPQTLSNQGDTGLVDPGGTIETSSLPAVTMANRDQILTNNGSIMCLGSCIIGIDDISNSNNVITNNSLITMTANASYSIEQQSSTSSQIYNNGTLSHSGSSSTAIVSGNNINTVCVNSGLVSISGGTSVGIGFALNTNSRCLNSGLISLSGGGSSTGFSSQGNMNVICANSGSILSSNVDSFGMSLEFCTNTVCINSGFISLLDNSVGIFANANTNTIIINSGTIIVPLDTTSYAIYTGDSNPTLTLLNGSILQGQVHTINPLLINVGPGLNLALTLDATSAAFIAGSIDNPYVIIDDAFTLAVVDPIGLAMQSDLVADLSDTVLNGVYRYQTAFSCCAPQNCTQGFWVEGLGSNRTRRHRSDEHYHNWQGGFLVGNGRPFSFGNVGIFGGVSWGTAKASRASENGDSRTILGGLTYEYTSPSLFLGTAFAAGYSNLSNMRYVANNLVLGGIEPAHAKGHGVFITPDITCAYQLPYRSSPFIVTGSLRYAGLFMGKFNETGSLANLTIKDRNIQLITARGELDLPFFMRWGVEPYAGVLGRFQVGGNHVDGTLLGVPLSFDVGSPRNLVALIYGFRALQKAGCLDLFLNIEGNTDNYQSTRFLGEGGIAFRF